MDKRGYPSWVQVTRVVDGGETPLFKQYFSDWVDEDDVVVPMPDAEVGSNVAGILNLELSFLLKQNI